MHLKIFLVLALVVSLVGISYIDHANAASHAFESEWGKAGISKSGFFLSPQHLAIDFENNIYVTDLGNSRVQKFDSNGNFLAEWGSKGSNPGQFGHPSGIAIFEEFVFVVDNKNHNVQKFDLNGKFVAKWGGFGNDNGLFKSPRGITISEDKFVYIVDSGNARIQKFTFDGEYVSHFGQSGKRGGNFVLPVDIAINSGKIYVTDPNQSKINVFDLDGNFKKTHNDSIGGYSIYPEGIVFDQEGNFYVVDYRNNRIIHFNDHFVPLSMFGQMGNGEGVFKFPKDVAVSSDGYLFITDTQGHRIQKFSTPLSQNSEISNDEAKISTEISSEIEQFTEPSVSLAVPIPNDFEKPTIMVPEDVLIEASGPLTVVNIGDAMATDPSGIYSLSNNSPESFPLGINTIIWTAIDGAGNMAIASQTVTIQDSTPPQITALENISLEAKSTDQNLVTLEVPKITDAVGVISINNDAPEVFPLGETIVTWTAKDVVGNVSTLSQSVILVDNVPPRIAFSEDIVIEAYNLEHNDIELAIPDTSDDVGVISINNDAPEVFPLGETIVTWTATDSSGNSATSTQTVTIVDTVIPEIIINDQILEATISGGTNIPLEFPVVVDIQNVELTNDAPEVFPLGETIVTWTATDSSGNSATSTQTVIIVDTTSPVLLVPENLQIEAQNLLTEIIDFGKIVAEDISGIASITNDAPEVFPLGETIVTWTATDNYNNIVSSEQIITIVDTTMPVIDAPSDYRIEASHIDQNIIDLVGVRVSDQVEISTITNDAPEVFPLGETIVTWTATDTSGNSASDIQQVLVVDTTAPQITSPADVEAEATSMENNIVDYGFAEASDQVEISTITNDAPEVFPLGETIVTWTATDSSGNSATSTQTVTIVDNSAPIITQAEDIVIEAKSQNNNIIEIPLIESDDNTKIASITNDAPISFEFGTTIVTWNVVDISGNISSLEQEIHVVDTTAPQITSPTDVEAEATSMENNIVDYGFAEASDQVEISTITNDAPEVFPLGETIVTWTATDSSGNSATSTQTVTIVDNSAPIITQAEDVTVNAISASNNVVVLEPISVFESISDYTITNNAPPYYEFGETIVTWTATDSSGNSATSTQTVTIVDNSAPILNIPANVVIDATSIETVLEVGLASAEDIIDTTPIITNDAPEVFPLGETIVTWTATDKFGNSSSEIQIISVQTCGNSPSYYNMIVGSEDDDVLIGTTLADLIFAHGGDDIISGNKGNDCILAGDGNDIIFGNEGNDNISGQTGNDIIKGQSGEDFIFGGLGLDIIDGGDDIDTCKIIDEQNDDVVIKCESNE